MAFSKHYRGELDYLLEMGRAFSRTHADARHLAERSGDPDVERLLEGFAFLAAKIHERVDNALPDVIHRMAELIAPQSLRPIPACTMVQFHSDLASMRGTREIPAGTELQSREVQGEQCTFRTTKTVSIQPFEVTEARMIRNISHSPKIIIDLQCNDSAQEVLRSQGQIEFFIHGESSTASMIILWLLRYCSGYSISDFSRPPGGVSEGRGPLDGSGAHLRARLPGHKISLSAFGDQDPLLPWSELVLGSYRLLAEYFTLPQKFRFVTLSGFEDIIVEGDRIRLEFDFDRPPEMGGNLDANAFRLHVSPAINLFECSADPIEADLLTSPRIIRGSNYAPQHLEIYDVVSVKGIPEGRKSSRDYAPFFAFQRERSGQPAPFYVLERRTSPIDDRIDTYIRVLQPAGGEVVEREILSMELLCTNRQLSHELKVGDISKSARGNTLAVSFENITAPTQPTRPPLDGELHWRLSAIMGLNRMSLAKADHLRAILDLYNAQAELQTAQGAANRNLSESIRDIVQIPTTRLMYGAPLRGSETTIEIDEHRLSPGEAFLFGQLLNELFAAHVNLNSFNELNLRLHPSDQLLRWTPRSGSVAIS